MLNITFRALNLGEIPNPDQQSGEKKKKKRNKKKKNSPISASETEPPKKSEPIDRRKSVPSFNEKLEASRFRFLNEQLYTGSSSDAAKLFDEDPDAFEAYHRGYRIQVS